MIRKGPFLWNDWSNDMTFTVYINNFPGDYIVFVYIYAIYKAFDDKYWKQREGILKRRSCQKTPVEIHGFVLSFQPTNQQKPASIV